MQSAIEVRDEDGKLLGFVNADVSLFDYGKDWVELLREPHLNFAVSFTEIVPYHKYEHCQLRWQRYRVGHCVYWCVCVGRKHWDRLLTSQPNRYRSTELHCHAFEKHPFWAVYAWHVAQSKAGRT